MKFSIECLRGKHEKPARGYRRKVIPALLVVLMASSVFLPEDLKADEGAIETNDYQLEPVVVTADKMEAEVYDTPTNITVITKEELSKYTARDVTDLLKQVPGLKISGLGYGNPGIGFFSTRGSEPDIRGVKIMVNGIDWSKGSGMFSPPRIPINDIERIEVIKTPSAMYGDQGSGGVINIITRVSDESHWKQRLALPSAAMERKNIFQFLMEQETMLNILSTQA